MNTLGFLPPSGILRTIVSYYVMSNNHSISKKVHGAILFLFRITSILTTIWFIAISKGPFLLIGMLISVEEFSGEYFMYLSTSLSKEVKTF